DRRGVVQALRDLVERAEDALAAAAETARCRAREQGVGGEQGPGPGPEVLGREVAAAHASQPAIDLARVERTMPAVAAQVLEQHLARQRAAMCDDAGDACVGEPAGVWLAALADELELQAGTVHL